MDAQSLIAIFHSLKISAGEQTFNESLAAFTGSALPIALPKTKKSKNPSANPSAALPKPPSPWNTLVSETVAHMKQSGWPSWTDSKGVVWPASRSAILKDKAGVEHSAYVFDGGEHDGKPVSPALGGMVRASYLKSLANPIAAQKGPAATAEPKKAGRPKMTEQQKAAAKAQRASASADESTSSGSKKIGRPKRTEEQKAAAKLKREANKAAKDHSVGIPSGWAELIEPVPAAQTPVKAPAKKVTPQKPTKKALDLSFYPWSHENTSYYTNDRGDVVSTEFEWIGHYDGKTLDTCAVAPEDLCEQTVRE